MKKLKDEVMLAACKDLDAGMRLIDVCAKYGISQTALYRFKKKFGGLSAKEIIQVKAEDSENNKLRRKVAEQERIIKALQAVVKKKF